MTAVSVKSIIVSAFKMHGYTLRSEASKYLVDILLPVSEVSREDWLDRILEAVQKQPLSSSVIDKATVAAAVQECSHSEDDKGEQILTIIDAFAIPRFTYVQDRKKFLPNEVLNSPDVCLHGPAKDKADIFIDRYKIMYQRTSRHDLFTPVIPGCFPEEANKKFQLKPVEYLLGCTAKVGDVIVLGMLTQIKEGVFSLEDPTGAVPLDLSNAVFHTGLFTENCFVLAEGWYEDKTFHVNAVGFPPAEAAKITRFFFGNVNFFGGPNKLSVKVSTKLQELEQQNDGAMFVFLSDIWLDQVKVIEKLRILFSGFSGFPPTCFVLCGNFTSQPYGPNHYKTLKESLHNFAQLLSEFPSLVDGSKFVFVPGPLDPGPGKILPRPSLPRTITKEIEDRMPNVTFASNPCRIQYCTQEIVVFREDIVQKMCRNCVRFPTSTAKITNHFVKTIISQGHLCPLPLHVSPVYWGYDAALRLYPVPDVIVCADKYDSFSEKMTDCLVFNPGSFPNSGFSFKVYMPATKQLDDSKIDT